MTELEKALNGLPYDSRDKEVVSFQFAVKKKCFTYNHTSPDDPERRNILSEIIGVNNPYIVIEPDFKCTFGRNIRFKGTAMLNYNCTLLDSDIITIGDGTLIGPGCNIISTGHAIDADERMRGVFNNKPVTIGDRVWIGANVTILPGVTIGDEAVIGAGSVVTKDIPSGVIAVGNPCKVLREISEKDRLL